MVLTPLERTSPGPRQQTISLPRPPLPPYALSPSLQPINCGAAGRRRCVLPISVRGST